MLAWYITRVKGTVTTLIYLLVFSMIVPFQMVMFTMSKFGTCCIWTIRSALSYCMLGSAGMARSCCGFIRASPCPEEAAMIDGATPVQTFFQVVMPMLEHERHHSDPQRWVWNDYLLPSDDRHTHRTIPSRFSI